MFFLVYSVTIIQSDHSSTYTDESIILLLYVSYIITIVKVKIFFCMEWDVKKLRVIEAAAGLDGKSKYLSSLFVDIKVRQAGFFRFILNIGRR